MDMDAVRKKRQEEIEAKRKRLDELKRAKEAAASAAKPADSVPKSTYSIPTPTSPLPSSRFQTALPSDRDSVPETKTVDTNDLVSSLLANTTSSSSGIKSLTNAGDFDVQYNRAEKIKSFSLVKLSTVLLPIERVTYNKECQTEEEDQTFIQNHDNDEDAYLGAPSTHHSSVLMTPGRKHSASSADTHQQHNSSSASNSFFSPSGTTTSTAVDATASAGSLTAQTHATRKISEEEKQQILADDRFLSFFTHAALHCERALEFNTEHDILRDYTADTSKQTSHGEKAVTHTQTFYDCEFLRHRPIMDLKCSVLRPELFLAAYGSKPSLSASASTAVSKSTSSSSSTEDDAPGLVCIWARDMHSRPEIRLMASSPVLTAEFHHSEPQLVFGGCYNGQILLWDMSQANRSLPVQRSSWVAGKGHKHPVYAMALTLSHELVSISIDGMLCLWDVSRLTEPITTAMLEIPVPRSALSLDSGSVSTSTTSGTSLFSPPPADFRVQQPPLNVSCMAYAPSENNASYIVVGSGAGELFKTQLPYKHTEVSNLKLDAHFGLITSVHMHPMTNSTKYKHLLLTSSLDWTVKMWSLNALQHPLFEFFSTSCDYICDVQWSPTHPAVFLTVSSTGQVSLWNLCKSVTEPVDTLSTTIAGETHDTLVGAGSGSGSSAVSGVSLPMSSALHKALFSRDGQYIVVGDASGVLHRLKVHATHVNITANEESRWHLSLMTAQNGLTGMSGSPIKHSKSVPITTTSGAVSAGSGGGGDVLRGTKLMDDFDEEDA